MPQPQGYKEELEKANGMILSIKEAQFQGSSHCLSLHSWAEELEAVRRATCREIRGLQPGAHVLVCTLSAGILSRPTCPCHQILATRRDQSYCLVLHVAREPQQALADPTWQCGYGLVSASHSFCCQGWCKMSARRSTKSW